MRGMNVDVVYVLIMVMGIEKRGENGGCAVEDVASVK